MPAAEPGDEQRPRPSPGSTTPSAPSPSRSPISTQVLLDRERCVLCQRCTRFSEQIAGDPFIELLERGALQQVGIYEDEPFQSYFSGNTVQICPVGALTGAAYRFRARPFDLVSTPERLRALRVRLRACAPTTGAARCCAGWPATTPRSTRSGTATRAAGRSTTPPQPDRLTHAAGPRRRRRAGRRRPGRRRSTSRPRGLAAARDDGGVGVLAGGRLTVEDAYAYAKFARVALGTNDIDFRARPHSRRGGATSWPRTSPGAGLERHLRRPGARAGRAARRARARGGVADPLPAAAQGGRASAALRGATPSRRSRRRGLDKLGGALIATAPGAEAAVLDAWLARQPASPMRPTLLHGRRARVILVGERLADGRPVRCPPRRALAEATGARLAWVPRRAGERGAVEAGRAARPAARRPPGGRRRGPRRGRRGLGRRRRCPPTPGRDTDGDPRRRARRRRSARWSSAASTRTTCPTRRPRSRRSTRRRVRGQPRAAAPARSPSAPTSCSRSPRPSRRPARFVDWEGRAAPVRRGAARHRRDARRAGAGRARRRDGRRPRRCPTSTPPARELAELGAWDGDRPAAPSCAAGAAAAAGAGEAVLATWHQLLDAGPAAGRRAVPRRHRPRRRSPGSSAATAAELGVADGEPVTVAHRPRRRHAAGGRHRDARRRGLAADQRAPAAPVRRDARRRRRVASCGSARPRRGEPDGTA